jgi:GT2 family glycosyltransferase
MPRISVVIPAFLARQTLPPEQYEIIVVDDGSTDETAERAARSGARVLRLPCNLGPAQARNAGLAAARADIVVFTDSDCEPAWDFLEALTAPLADTHIAATKGVYASRQRGLVPRFVQLEYMSRYRHTAAAPSIDFIDTHAACYRRADLLQLGGFDSRFRVCEDQELSFRVAEAGLTMRFVPAARAYHLHAESLREYLSKKFRIGWWKAAVLRKHPRRALHDSHTPQTLKVEIASAYAVAVSAATLLLHPRSRRQRLAMCFALGVHAALTADFVQLSVRRDLAVAIAAPFILFCRDLALGAGLGIGLLQQAGWFAVDRRD